MVVDVDTIVYIDLVSLEGIVAYCYPVTTHLGGHGCFSRERECVRGHVHGVYRSCVMTGY